jgi:hypothetical protein
MELGPNTKQDINFNSENFENKTKTKRMSDDERRKRNKLNMQKLRSNSVYREKEKENDKIRKAFYMNDPIRAQVKKKLFSRIKVKKNGG